MVLQIKKNNQAWCAYYWCSIDCDSLTITLDDKCLFKCCFHCNDTDRLQVSQSSGEILHNIMNASKQQGDDLHTGLHAELEVDPNYKAKYHKSCFIKYLTKAQG